ncbi:MAG: hypothetical protein QG597_1267 [Actinomycetota bacterium]|nr:hypothetical protein [Actinomycetota bacterium]
MNIDEIDMLYTQIQMVDNRRDADEFTLAYWKKLLDREGVEHFHIASAAVDNHRTHAPGTYLEPGHVAKGYKELVRRMMAGFREEPPALGDPAGYMESIRQQRADYLALPESLDRALGVIELEQENTDVDTFRQLAIERNLPDINQIGRIT